MSGKVGNPAPIGLMAFALTIFMLGSLNAKIVDARFKELVTTFGFWWAGLGQVATGLFELMHGNSFGALVFCTYGSLWVALSTVWFYTRQNVRTHEGYLGAHHYENGESLMLALFLAATAFFFVMSLRKNRALQTCLFLLFWTFLFLCIGEHVAVCKKIGGWGCMATGCSAFYILAAEIVNEEWGYAVLPGLKPCVQAKVVDNFASLYFYDLKENKVFLNLSGIHVLSSQDVQKLSEGLDGKFAELKKKVHVVANYQGTEIAPAIQAEFTSAVETLQSKYYLTVKRFAATAFRAADPMNDSMNVPLPARRRTGTWGCDGPTRVQQLA